MSNALYVLADTTSTIAQPLNCVSAVAALAAQESSTIVARFQNLIVCEGKARPQLKENVEKKLSEAFGGATFNVRIS